MAKKRVSLNERLSRPITSTVSAFTTNVVEKNDSVIDKNNETKNVTNNVTEVETDSGIIFDKNSNTRNIPESDTNNDIINDSNDVPIITQNKSIRLGNTTFKSIYNSNDKVKRSAYYLRKDTIEKIDKCSKLSGMKKAEFVDLILNNVLTDILNKIEK